MADWEFYGRKEQLAALKQMLDRKRWFFAKVTGRRRIGKTTLIQHAMEELGNRQQVFYVQIPDSEPAGVLSAVNDALETFHVPADRHPRPNDLLQLAKLPVLDLGAMLPLLLGMLGLGGMRTVEKVKGAEGNR